MDIEKLLNKDNIKYFIAIFKSTSKEIIMKFFIALILICLIIDIKIAHTTPAYTLIAIIISWFGVSCKDIIIREDKKLTEITVKNYVNEAFLDKEPYLQLLEENEKTLLKRFIDENKQSVIWSLSDYTIYGNMTYKGIDFITIVPYPHINKNPDYIAKISPVYFEVLKRFFSY